MQPILSIDPGASGGLAWRDSDGIVHAERIPDGMPAIVDRLRALTIENKGLLAIVERVGGYMPGNSGPAACKFARHCGHIDAALYALGVPVRQVAPSVWMRALGALPADKGARKRSIRDLMATRYPHLDVTLATADALGILTAEVSG